MYHHRLGQRTRCIVAASAGILMLTVAASPADELLIEHGFLVDPRTETVERGNLLIVDGVIATAPPEVPASFSGRRLDATGKWVMPALRDMHTHSYGNAGLAGQVEFVGTPTVAKRMLYAGVAAFLDLFSPEDAIFGLRDGQRSEGLPGAEIFAAGPCLTATDGHCTEYGVPTRVIDTPEQARREVGVLAAKQPDVVKVVYHHTPGAMPSIDRATLRAAIEAATAAGLPTVVHVGTWEDAWHAVEAGATAITHIPRGSVVSEQMARDIAARGTLWIPTLAVHFDRPNFASGVLREDPMLIRLLAPNVLESYASSSEAESAHASGGAPIDRKARRRERLASLERMLAAGVSIVAGTDSGNVATVQGYSLHRELQLMVENGVPTWQALRSATVEAGRLLGRDWGLDVGSEGSLLLLDSSPIEDISATQDIDALIHRGRQIDREALLDGGS